MSHRLLEHMSAEIAAIRAEGLLKQERLISTPQGASVAVDGREDGLLNFCANNYLGLANHPELRAAAMEGLERYGFGMASVRFICGTQTAHRELEQRISAFLGTEDTILYSSCFDANGGLFETILGEQDAVVSDALNHASIIDGIRLSKARRFRYANDDMEDLERQLASARADGARHVLVATDGVFSMDGIVARLDRVCELANRYDAAVMVDDSHAVGFMGAHGRGTHEHCGVIDRVDVITGTLGKALGGASGGYTSGRKEIIALLRQRSRPYLFSNSLAPPIVAASLRVIDMLEGGADLRERLHRNAALFREGMQAAGFRLGGAGHPIVPVMIGDAALAARMAEDLLARGVYAVAFSYPVVPKGAARIRVQLSAAHAPEHIGRAIEAFVAAARATGVLTAGR